MNIEDSLKKLYSLHQFGVKLGLDNIKGFLNYLKNPQSKLKAFHIAGSNGKGSTAAFTASILREFGYKTGLYTSPHYVRFNERITVDNEEIPDEYVADFISAHVKYIDEQKLTFFEVTTAMAFQYFRDKKVDYAVIETGLGGRLDATNVLNPVGIIITSISLEHTNVLGNTVEEIAGEKAAIIKNHSKVFIGKMPPEAENVFLKKCQETNSDLFLLEEYVNEKENGLELYTEEIELDEWTMPLRGDFQKYNAALAALAVSKVFDSSDFNLLSLGIKNVINNTNIQGRYEYFNNSPDIIFDSAHNPEGIVNFLSEFRKDSHQYKKKVLLFGVMRDKSVTEMLGNLKEHFDEIHITEIEYERSLKINEMLELAEGLKLTVIPEPDPVNFINEFKEGDINNCMVVLGSMYLIGHLKSFLTKSKLA